MSLVCFCSSSRRGERERQRVGTRGYPQSDIACLRQMWATAGKHVCVGRLLLPRHPLSTYEALLGAALGYENPRALLVVRPREISPGEKELVTSEPSPSGSRRLECFCSGMPGPAPRLVSCLCAVRAIKLPCRCPGGGSPVVFVSLTSPASECLIVRGWRYGAQGGHEGSPVVEGPWTPRWHGGGTADTEHCRP